MQITNSEILAKETRKLALKMVTKAKASHIGSALSMTDILAVLYFDLMKIFPENSNHQQRDLLILSKGHACVSLYAILGLKGFFNLKELIVIIYNGRFTQSNRCGKTMSFY